MFPNMWSRGIIAVALCVTCVTGTLAALPEPAGTVAGGDAGGQSALMRALEQAPQVVAAWKRAEQNKAGNHGAAGHDAARRGISQRPGRAGRTSKGKGRVKSRL